MRNSGVVVVVVVKKLCALAGPLVSAEEAGLAQQLCMEPQRKSDTLVMLAN
jgi:hypothetical protein